MTNTELIQEIRECIDPWRPGGVSAYELENALLRLTALESNLTPVPQPAQVDETRKALARLASSIDLTELRKTTDKIGWHPEEIESAVNHARFLLR